MKFPMHNYNTYKINVDNVKRYQQNIEEYNTFVP